MTTRTRDQEERAIIRAELIEIARLAHNVSRRLFDPGNHYEVALGIAVQNIYARAKSLRDLVDNVKP